MGSIHAAQIHNTFGTLSPPEKSVTAHIADLTTPRRVVSGMKFFPDSVRIQRAGAKQLSNISFDVQNVPAVLKRGGLKRLVKSIKSHGEDWKLCWFGASAIWNMARPAEQREEVGATVGLLLEMLRRHQGREQVAHTVLGALSNLALHETNAPKVVTPESLDLIFDTLKLHKGSCQVMTSSLGLIANLSIAESVAATLAEHGAVRWVVSGLAAISEGAPNTETRQMLLENGMAALSNLTFVEDFPRHFLLAQGVEMLCYILRNREEFPLVNEDDLPLLNNILQAVGLTQQHAEDERLDLYSLHQAAGLLDVPAAEVLRAMLEDPAQEAEALLDLVDGLGMRPLDYAVALERTELAAMLITSGATVTDGMRETAVGTEMEDVIEAAEGDLQAMLYATTQTVDAATGLHPDLCGVVVDFLSKYELSKHVLEPLKGN